MPLVHTVHPLALKREGGRKGKRGRDTEKEGRWERAGEGERDSAREGRRDAGGSVLLMVHGRDPGP